MHLYQGCNNTRPKDAAAGPGLGCGKVGWNPSLMVKVEPAIRLWIKGRICDSWQFSSC